MNPVLLFRRIVPSAVRSRMRRSLDWWFCRRDLPLGRIGDANTWWIAPALLGPDTRVLSGGAGNDISFELALARRFKCSIALFDPSPTGQSTLARVPESDRNRLNYFPVGFADRTHTASFALPSDSKEGSYSITQGGNANAVSFECLAPTDALARAGFDSCDLLKIDIEGFEYGFLAALLASPHRPAQIAVEFHHFLKHISFRQTWITIRALRRAGYRIAHKEQCDYLFIHVEGISRLKRRNHDGV